jgi:hypothetical protein
VRGEYEKVIGSIIMVEPAEGGGERSENGLFVAALLLLLLLRDYR